MSTRCSPGALRQSAPVQLAQRAHGQRVDAHQEVAALQACGLGGAAGHDARDRDAVLARLRVEADPGVPLGVRRGVAALDALAPLDEQTRRDRPGCSGRRRRGRARRCPTTRPCASSSGRAGEAGVHDRRHDRRVEHELPERLERADEGDVAARAAPLLLAGAGEQEHRVARPARRRRARAGCEVGAVDARAARGRSRGRARRARRARVRPSSPTTSTCVAPSTR